MATGEGKGKTLMDCRERWGRASRGRRALHQGYVRLQHTLYQVPVAKLRQLCPEWDLVNEIFAEKDGGDEELRTGTSNTADITLGALLDGEGVVRGRGDRALPPGTQQASHQHSPRSSQGVEDTLPDLPPP